MRRPRPKSRPLASGRPRARARRPPMLEKVDLSLNLSREEYTRRLDRLQNQLHLLAYQVYLQKRPAITLFEGWDAAGKGGAIKRMTARLDPRGYVVWPIAAPEGDDKT